MDRKSVRAVFGMGGATLIALVLGGCATSGYQEPTHRWVSSSQSTSNQYRADNTTCMSQSGGTTSQRAFATSSPEYRAYVACMSERGYALTATDLATTR